VVKATGLYTVRKELSSSDADILEGLGDMYWLAGKWDKGEEYYRKVLSLEPENPERMNILANRLIDRSRNLSEVTEHMNMALERASTKCDYYNYLDTKGYGFYKFGKYQEGLEVLQKTWNLAPFKLYFIISSRGGEKSCCREEITFNGATAKITLILNTNSL
jgi:tetratricopeptide (TPR) repeat protein